MSANLLPANPLIPVFMGQWLSNKALMGAKSTISNVIPVRGNYVRLQYLMITLAATSGTATVDFSIEATADGGTWDLLLAAKTIIETGPDSSSVSTLGYSHLRVRAEATAAGTNTKAFFNAALVFAESGG